MQFLTGNTDINFIGKKKLALIFSLTLILVSMASLVIKGGPNYGIDFRGGSLLQLKFEKPVSPGDIRSALAPLSIGDFSVQQFGSPEEIIINVEQAEKNGSVDNPTTKIVEEELKKNMDSKFIVERVEMVGPKVGKDLRQKALMAIFYALLGILIYISLRFEFRFGVSAIIALCHDTIITIGAFSLFDKEFTLSVIAALLTVIGYSLNDTIVVFDRIRDNIKLKRGKKLFDILNLSINQTLSRTLLTSGTTLVVVASIFLFGGEVIHDFAFALLVGIFIGTYSSIYVASPILLAWEGYKEKKRHRK